jgi:hypothetical protein
LTGSEICGLLQISATGQTTQWYAVLLNALWSQAILLGVWGSADWLHGLHEWKKGMCSTCSDIGAYLNAELMDLRQKFAEDRRRIAELKASRKFKPY